MRPHLIRYWLTPPPADDAFVAAVADVNGLYREAPRLAAVGERILSSDELTGVQALERKHPGLPPVPGKVERREFAYVRHGTRTFIISRDVATGQIVAPSCGPTRTEAGVPACGSRRPHPGGGGDRPGRHALALRGG